jgi:hypothetical protein
VPRRTALGAAGEPVEVELRVRALKPLEMRAELVAQRSEGGGSWRFPLRLSVAPAPPDGVINVTSRLNVPTSTVFGQRNGVPRASAFTARFTLDSPGEFTVSPARGVLPSTTAALYAVGTGGEAEAAAAAAVPITITFTPREYGVKYAGALIVETDEMLWRYEVVGSLPKYAPPTAKDVRGVDDRLEADVRQALEASRDVAARRDHVAANIKSELRPHEPAAGRMLDVGAPSAHGAHAAGAAPRHSLALPHGTVAEAVAHAALAAGTERPILHPAAQHMIHHPSSSAASAQGNRPPSHFGAPHSATYLGPAGSLLSHTPIRALPPSGGKR